MVPPKEQQGDKGGYHEGTQQQPGQRPQESPLQPKKGRVGDVGNLQTEEDTEPSAKPIGGCVQEVPFQPKELADSSVLHKMEKAVEAVGHPNPLQEEAADCQAKEDEVRGKEPSMAHPFSAQSQYNKTIGQESQETKKNKEQHKEECECWLHSGPSQNTNLSLSPRSPPDLPQSHF